MRLNCCQIAFQTPASKTAPTVIVFKLFCLGLRLAGGALVQLVVQRERKRKRKREKRLLQDSHYHGECMIMIGNPPGSQVGPLVAAEEGGGGRGGGGRESRERTGVRSKSTLESTAPKARSRSRAGTAMNGVPNISPRVSGKSPSSASSSLSSSDFLLLQDSHQ